MRTTPDARRAARAAAPAAGSRGAIRPGARPAALGGDPLWYKDAIIYELHVRAFFDSDNDGVGDFRGLTQRLGYLEDLGVTAVWLLPFYPSPLRDDGYDIADYTAVHPAYGTLRDFEAFLREAHRRGLRVITELVLNHTSDQHPWFQRARRAKPGNPARDFYVWSDTPERYRDARIIFKDFETSNWSWDPVAGAYFWHRFYAHQPDLNFDHPPVREAMLRVVDFWFGMGVDGMRLDAVPYLYEREGTNCENLPETHAFLRELRRHVDARYPGRMLLAEANQWPEDAAAYFGAGDECHMAFHFPLMPRLFMAIRMEDRFPIIDMLEQTPPIPETCQWALFLRNHDELTLEMVTDEERDYMYRVYATDPQARINLGIRRRLAPLLGNHHRRIELMNALLLSLPGTPVVYYGDEIGMGDNIYLGDRNGVRTPMHWSPDRNAGFSRANPQRLYLPVITDPEYHYEAVNVEAQQNNPYSRLWWTRRIIGLRKEFRAFSRGSLRFLLPDNPRILAFLRRDSDETILVVANLSRFVEFADLDLREFTGWTPVELFGRKPFPPIGEAPYRLTPGPHAFFWFRLVPPAGPGPAAAPPPALPEVRAPGGQPEGLTGPERAGLEQALARYLPSRRWLARKAPHLKSVRLADLVPVGDGGGTLALVRAEYTEGEAETYVVALAASASERVQRIARESPGLVVGRLAGVEDGFVVEGLADPAFAPALLDAIRRGRRLRGLRGEVTATRTRAFAAIAGDHGALEPRLTGTEQSNSTVVFGDRLVLKLFRRLEPGVNPELEVCRFLTARGFAHIPTLAGALEYRAGRDEPQTLAVLQQYVPNEGDGWSHAQRFLAAYFQHAEAQTAEPPGPPVPAGDLLTLAEQPPPLLARELMAPYLDAAALLGRRTAEMHLALAADPADPAFAPEPFSALYQRSVYQSLRSHARAAFQRLRRAASGLPAETRALAEAVLDREGEILRRLRVVLERRLSGMRIRCHGDYHLGQVLHTGKDFVIFDFEGEAARPLGQRRLKRSPLVDVAGMLRSFHYAAFSALESEAAPGERRGREPRLRAWAAFWVSWAAAAFLGAYLRTMAQAPRLLPRDRDELAILLDAYVLEKAVYEVDYELANRPDRLGIPLRGILDMLDATPASP